MYLYPTRPQRVNKVKGGSRLADRPGARGPAIQGWHFGTSWNPRLGIPTSPIQFFHHFCFYYTVFWWNWFSNGLLMLVLTHWPLNDTRWWWIYWSTVAQMMACRLIVPSLCLSKCWLQIVGIHPHTVSLNKHKICWQILTTWNWFLSLKDFYSSAGGQWVCAGNNNSRHSLLQMKFAVNIYSDSVDTHYLIYPT